MRSVLLRPWRLSDSACRPFDPREASCIIRKRKTGGVPRGNTIYGVEANEGNSTQMPELRARRASDSPSIGPEGWRRKDRLSVSLRNKIKIPLSGVRRDGGRGPALRAGGFWVLLRVQKYPQGPGARSPRAVGQIFPAFFTIVVYYTIQFQLLPLAKSDKKTPPFCTIQEKRKIFEK